MRDAPTGTVTFLFTDLETSTRLWEEEPRAMQDALARRDAILRRAIESHDGYVVKTTGDGIHAAFGTARAALDAAVDAQLALAAEPWPETGPLRVRMGLHTGEADLRDGDYYGTALNRAARIMSAGYGDQILVSRATEELVHDSLPDQCELMSLGEHRLRDLGRPEMLLQLTHPELPRTFPPPRSVDAYPNNLPLQLTSFVGRGAEMNRIAATVGNSRLVTLSGVGGVGKTRLAVQVAGEVLPDFPDGAWLCELAVASDPDSLVQVVAAALNVQPHPTVPLDERIRNSLREKQALVVLDNCEHLLDAASRLAEGILRSCPSVRMIATSREPLDLDGERIVRVRSLPVPEEEVRGDTTDAVRLFVERAQAVEPDFEPSGADLPAVEEICRRLDGMPLAIELAAARVVAMSPNEIAGLLDERFRLLTGGRRTAVERHQTLRATVDWSYSLLDPRERAVFDRLGVFPGSFDATAARAVCRGEGVEEWDVLDALRGLVNKSMVNAVAADATTRYVLLETMRQYARERLDQEGDADNRRRAHAEHYTQLCREQGRAFAIGEGADWWVRTADLELHNFRAAVAWALDSRGPGDPHLALSIAAQFASAELSVRRGGGLIANSDRLLEIAESGDPALHAAILAGLANDALLMRGDLDAAENYATRAMAAQAETHEVATGGGVPMASAMLCMCAQIRGDFDRAQDVILEARQIMRDAFGPVPNGEAYFESMLSSVERSRGDYAAAIEHARESVHIARRANFPFRLVTSLNALAGLLRYDDWVAAKALAEEAVELGYEHIRLTGVAAALMAISELERIAGHLDESLRRLRDGIRAWGDDASSMSIAACAHRASMIFASMRADRAAVALGGAAEHGIFSQLLTVTIDARGREELRLAIEGLRERMDDDDFASEWARGAAMTGEETMRLIAVTADDLLND